VCALERLTERPVVYRYHGTTDERAVGTASGATPVSLLVPDRDRSTLSRSRVTEDDDKGDVGVLQAAFLEDAEARNGAASVKVAATGTCTTTSPYPLPCRCRAWWLPWAVWMKELEDWAEWRHHARTAFAERWNVRGEQRCRC
jgi:hypothetical protein